MVLVARGLRKSYKGTVAVDGIDVELRRGECLALLGPNGAGKTTTVEMLEGLTPPDAGRVELLGHRLPGGRRAALQKVGVLLQETNLYKRYTVRETLALFASFYAASVDLDALIARLSLEDKADAQLRTLSGGQKQRAYIACALVNDPELLFLDEPTTGLDPQARRAIWDLLAGVKGEGRSILLTTHYMEEAAVLADRVAIVDHGKVIAEGAPRELVRRTIGEQALWVELAGGEMDRARLAARLPWFGGAEPLGEGYAIATADLVDATRALLGAAKDADVAVKGLRIREGTLEDVFLKLTGRSIRNGG
jgi:ABC-2 type transport system ATP-binding protein